MAADENVFAIGRGIEDDRVDGAEELDTIRKRVESLFGPLTRVVNRGLYTADGDIDDF